MSGFSNRYPHPFTPQKEWEWIEGDQDDPPGKDTPLTLIELKMCALSAAIREKPDWHVKYRNDEIRAKWRQEIEEQQLDSPLGQKLTENMINYVMGELEGYAALRDENTGIEAGPYERIWKSDSLIPAALKSELLQAIVPLESIPDDQKDWHPRSNNQVLDLVHPSLYPVVYGRSCDRTGAPLAPRDNPDVPDELKSDRFQWLPSDFIVDAQGRVTLASPYINNIHPEEQAALAAVVPRVLERAVPLFECVLSDLARETQLPSRLPDKFPKCIWGGSVEDEPSPYDDENAMAEIYAEMEQMVAADEARRTVWEARRDAWYAEHKDNDEEEPDWMQERVEVHPTWKYEHEVVEAWTIARGVPNWPDGKPAYDGALGCMRKTESLRSTRVQVIVKLANIMLTPENPEYQGGTWHVEGMDNESIVSTFIYYYDSENITESTLSFRNATAEPRHHGHGDSLCMKFLYGMYGGTMCAQEIGEIVTKMDRCIVFPNIYQHRVSSFGLADPSKPGYRKILAFFLVDPHIRIPSASDVGPQQASWIRKSLERTALWNRLPTELRDYVWGFLNPIEHAEALRYREELMDERTASVKTVDGERFGQMFNLCEH